MKALILLAICIAAYQSCAADTVKLLKEAADGAEKTFNDPKASPAEIKLMQNHMVQMLRGAAVMLEKQEKLSALNTKLASLGKGPGDGKSCAVPRTGKVDEYEGLTTRDGVVYKNVKVLGCDNLKLKFSHAEGVASVWICDIPEDMALKYIKLP